jgi:hypothetical protein
LIVRKAQVESEYEAADDFGGDCVVEGVFVGGVEGVVGTLAADSATVVSFVDCARVAGLQRSSKSVHLTSRAPIVGIARSHSLVKPHWLEGKLSWVVEEHHKQRQVI